MKKTIALTLVALLLLSACLLFVGCEEKTYTVTLMSKYNKDFTKQQKGHYISASDALINGSYDGVWDKIEVKENDVIGNIEIDTKKATQKGVKFCGWYVDESYTIQWNPLQDPVKKDIRLYAKWEEI